MHGDVITDLGLGLFADVDLVIGCLDNREARLWVNRQCWKIGTPWIDAGHPGDPGRRQGLRAARFGLLRVRDDRARLPAPQPPLQLPAPEAGRDPGRQGAHRPDDRVDDGGAAGPGGAQAAARTCRSRPARPWCTTASATSFTRTKLPFREDCLSHETYPAPSRASAGPRQHRRRALRRGPGRARRLRFSLGLDRELVVADRLPAVRLASGDHAAADEGPARPRRSARTAASRAVPRSSAPSIKDSPLARPAAGRRGRSGLRYRAGRRRFGIEVLPSGR